MMNYVVQRNKRRFVLDNNVWPHASYAMVARCTILDQDEEATLSGEVTTRHKQSEEEEEAYSFFAMQYPPSNEQTEQH
jgi:hypothetical protein